jgi:muramidase (phage lysozyme)
MPRITPEQAGGANVCAFLDMLAVSEIGEGLLHHSDDGYDVLVGSTARAPLLFDSYAAHPAVYNRRLNSTAAGRYQLLARYWPAYKAKLGLPDFGPVSQDRIAIQQIKERGALGLVQSGHLTAAIAKVSNIWASLPGAGYGQHENDMASLREAYTKAHGVLA